MFDRALGSDRSWRSWRRTAKLAPFFIVVGVSFGFIGVVFAIGYESYFRLPAGIEDQRYVTLLRREADSGRSTTVRVDDVANITALAPEVRWAYAARSPSKVTLHGSDGGSETVSSRYVSPNYLELLGVEPAVGQVAAVDGATVAVISGSLWRRLYGSDANVLGRLLATEFWGDLPIVGVTAHGFDGVLPGEADVWLLGSRTSPGSQGVGTITTITFPVVLIGVIRDSTSVPAMRSLFDSYAFANTEHDRLELVAGLETLPDRRRNVRERLSWLALVVVLLLLQVFLSLVDRLLAEHHSRREEQAVRLAVGATPADMFAGMVAGHAGWMLIVGFTAALAGIYIADLLLSVEPFSHYIGEFSSPSLAWGFGASALLLLLAFVLSGAYVSRLASRTGHGISVAALHSAGTVRLARAALLFVAAASLLIVASLGARYAKDARVSTGVANGNALMMQVIYYGDLTTALELLTTNPGVVAAAQAEMLPLLAETIGPHSRAVLSGRRAWEDVVLYRNGVAPTYFDVLGVELLAGRVFDGAAKSEVVLSRKTAEFLAEGRIEDALGMAFPYVTDTTPGRARGVQLATVVGVVEDVAYGPVHEVPRRVFYQMVDEPGAGLFVVKEASGGSDVLTQLQQHPDIEGAYRIGTVAEIYDDLVLAPRSAEVVLAVAAGLALTLALVGVALSLAKEIAGSSHGTGVRLALGATPRDITAVFCARPIFELLIVVALIAALAVLAKLLAPAFMSFVELWLALVVIPLLAAAVVLVALWLASRAAKVRSVYSLLGTG